MKTIEKCAFCGGELKSGKSSITTHKTSDYEYTVFNEPYLECIKCRGCFSADPDQNSKTSKFMVSANQSPQNEKSRMLKSDFKQL